MYLQHWSLDRPPFENTPSPAFFYPSCPHVEAMERIKYAVLQGKGAAMISGGVGCGKTTVGQTIIGQLQRDRYQVVAMTNPALDSLDFIQMVVDLFQVPYEGSSSKAKMWQSLEKKLRRNLTEGTGSVLFIDEAQVILNQKTLEELRMLLNLQLYDKFLVNVILIGQLELEEQIKSIEPLDQRISIQYRLLPLPFIDTVKYIKHRLHIAGCTKIPFTIQAFYTIHEYTKGIPRKINNLCDRSLLAAYLEKKRIVSKEVVVEAWQDLHLSSLTLLDRMPNLKSHYCSA